MATAKKIKTRKKKSGFWGKTAKERKRLELRYELVSIKELKEWEDNPRINEEAVPQLVGLIQKHGWAGAIVATPDGVIRAGHTRFKAMKKLGKEKIWVHWKNFPSEKAAEAYALADNKSSEWTTWDHTKLARLFKKRLSIDEKKLTGFTRNQIDWGGRPPQDLTKLSPKVAEEGVLFAIRIIWVRQAHVKRITRKIEKILERYNADLPKDEKYIIKVF